MNRWHVMFGIGSFSVWLGIALAVGTGVGMQLQPARWLVVIGAVAMAAASQRIR